MRIVSLTVGEKADLLSTPDEIEPRRDLKAGPGVCPIVDRSQRGDPLVGLRPTLDTRLRGGG